MKYRANRGNQYINSRIDEKIEHKLIDVDFDLKNAPFRDVTIGGSKVLLKNLFEKRTVDSAIEFYESILGKDFDELIFKKTKKNIIDDNECCRQLVQKKLLENFGNKFTQSRLLESKTLKLFYEWKDDREDPKLIQSSKPGPIKSREPELIQ